MPGVKKKVQIDPNLQAEKKNEKKNGELHEKMSLLCVQRLRGVFSNRKHDKFSRDGAVAGVRKKAFKELSGDGYGEAELNEVFTSIKRSLMADMAIEEGVRVDGRQLGELRDISCQVDLHKPLHGSALFQRGQTQVLCTVALDSLESALKASDVDVLLG